MLWKVKNLTGNWKILYLYLKVNMKLSLNVDCGPKVGHFIVLNILRFISSQKVPICTNIHLSSLLQLRLYVQSTMWKAQLFSIHTLIYLNDINKSFKSFLLWCSSNKTFPKNVVASCHKEDAWNRHTSPFYCPCAFVFLLHLNEQDSGDN